MDCGLIRLGLMKIPNIVAFDLWT